MSETGLRALSAHDFEILCQDLLGQELGMTLEGFTAGRDRGIDLRLLRPPHRTPDVVVQCKHYITSGYSALKSRIQAEATKSAQVGASRFILATSVSMTPHRKQELSETLCGAGVRCGPEDILGREDLDRILRANPAIERAHYKLWLGSSALLQQMINNGILVRSEGYLEELRHKAALFVENKSVDDALALLSEYHTCLISGAPGVGKSTLAEILLLHAISEGYRPIIVSSDVGEADQMYLSGEKQVFFYDDFLGRTTTFERLGKNEDDRVVRLIERIGRAPTKRLILTTREYILQQARLSFDRLSNRSVDLTKYVLDVGVYTRRNRAHILYNHVYFAGVSEGARQSLREDRNYLDLVDHENYNPRLISDAVSLFSASGEPDDLFGDFLLHAFEDPSRLWAQVFNHQFTAGARYLLAFVPLLEPPLSIDALERAHVALAAVGVEGTFEDAMRILEGTALTIGGRPFSLVDFTNPGVADSVLTSLLSEPQVLITIVASAFEFDQLVKLWSYATEPERGLPATNEGRNWNTLSSASYLLTLVDRKQLVLRGAMRRRLEAIADRFVANLVRLLSSRIVGDRSRAVRLSLAIGISEDLGATSVAPAIEAELRAELARWASGSDIDKEPVLELVTRAARSTWLSAEVRDEMYRSALAWFADDLSWPKDYELLARLRDVAEAEEEGRALADLRDEFVATLQNYISEWSDSDDADVLRGLLDDIESASRVLAYDLDTWSDWDYESWQIRDRIDDLERDLAEPDDDWREYRSEGSDGRDQGDDAWIDALFDTLTE